MGPEVVTPFGVRAPLLVSSTGAFVEGAVVFIMPRGFHQQPTLCENISETSKSFSPVLKSFLQYTPWKESATR